MRAFLLVLLLAGCAATGPAFNEASLPNGKQSSLVIYRPAAYLGAGAGLYSVDINGETVCRLHPGSFFIKTKEPGEILVSSSTWDTPGTSRIKVNTKPKQTYYIKMIPNDGKQVAGIMGGMIGLWVAEGLSDTGGQFIFMQMDEQVAKSELSTLKQDCL